MTDSPTPRQAAREAAAKASTLRAALGPGLLMAGAAVGVSHLVQSTRAGAEYGLSLLVLVLVGCAARYPFLEFGPRYAAATGEHMIAGYRRLGRWPVALFALLTVSTMFIVQASITLVTAGLTGSLLGSDWPVSVLAALVLLATAAILLIGHYRGLDLIMKIIMAVLSLATLVAVALALGATPDLQRIAPEFGDAALLSGATLGFVLALLGWMPIPLEAAAWHSLWTLERAETSGAQPSVRHAATDFAIGYLGATVLAVAFMLLGALTLYGGETALAESAVAFAGQLIAMYAGTLGDWARGLIAFAALATMISTTLTVADAYPRVLRALLELRDPRTRYHDRQHRPRYVAGLAVLLIGSWLVIWLFGNRFTALIDFTTTVSFLAAPLIAALNLVLIRSRHVPAGARPGPAYLALSIFGLVFLAAFSAVWLAWRLGVFY